MTSAFRQRIVQNYPSDQQEFVERMELRIRQSLRFQWTSGGVSTAGNYWWTVTLVMTWMMADFGYSLLQSGPLPTSFPELRHPRIQIVHTRADQGALIRLYNVPEIPADGNIPIHCSVTGGTWKFQGKWVQVKDVTLYEPSRPTIWHPPGISWGHLQSRTDVKVEHEVEGLLVCTYIPMGLISNRLILRFENAVSIVVGLLLPSIESIYETMKDIGSQTKDDIFARPQSIETVTDRVKVVAKVTYFGSNSHVFGVDKNDDSFVLALIENKTHEATMKNNGSLLYARSTRYCHLREDGEYTWPTTTAGRTTVPLNPCVREDGVPGPKRPCRGDFFQGVYWEEAWSGPGAPCTKAGARSRVIQNIIPSAHEEGSLEELRSEIAEGPPLRLNEIILVSRFLTIFARSFAERKSGVTLSPQKVDTISNVVSRVLDSEREVIEGADDASGASEDLLDAVDLLVSAAAKGPLPVNVSRPHFAAATSPHGSDVLGVAAISTTDPSEGSKLVHVPCNTSIEDVVAMSPVAAVLLLECPKDRKGVASTVFEVDTLFISRDKGEHAAGPVIGFTQVEGGHDEDWASQETVTVLVLFAMENGKETNCSFWDKGKRTWSGGSCATVPQPELPDSMRGCLCTHLTHFAMIISTGNNYISEREKKDGDKCTIERKMNEPLENLSLISCSVSLAFLICTFLVAALYPSWRSGAGRKIQLHLSASLALLMAAYIIVSLLPTPVLPGFPVGFCVAMGALLHYSLLAAFSWTLVVAILQALRLSPRSVLDSRSRAGTHLVMKASAFGWGMPLIPVVVTLMLGPELYPVRPCTALCYPEGVVFYATVFAPVGLVVFVNAFVFSAIMRFMFCTPAVGMRVHHGARDRVYLKRFLFTIFLFILLGLNWAVGLLLEAFKWDAAAHRYIAYAFCSTATLQGASLFVFFVGCERKVSGRISNDLGELKSRSFHLASRFRHKRSSHSTSDKTSSTTPTTPSSAS